MARIYIGLDNDAAQNTEVELSGFNDAALTRFLDWVWSVYPQYEADGVTEKPKNQANRNAAFQQWANGFFASTKAQVKSYETQTSAAVQAAKDAIGEFDA